MFVLSFIIGLVGEMHGCKYYLAFVIILYLIEVYSGKYTNTKLKNLSVEFIIIITMLLVGYKINHGVKYTIKK